MFRTLTPAVQALLLANVIVYLLQSLTGYGEQLVWNFALWPLGAQDAGGAPFEPWQLLTYAFLHEGWLHIGSNMLALFMFGPDGERVLGTRRFTVYYFVCVLGAALAQLAVTYYSRQPSGPTVGASGGIFGVLLLYGMAFPHRRVLLIFPPIPMPAWLFVTLYGLWELYMGATGNAAGVAHFAHLGGMVTGFAMIQFWRNRIRA